MIKINIFCVGSIKEKFYKDAISEYSKRLSKFVQLNIIETHEEKIQNKSEDEVKNIEASNILKRIKDNDYLILLDLHGKEIDSLELSNRFKNLVDKGVSPINIVIGGTLGLGSELLKRSNERICFSKMTFPHQLMRVILLEQIYRSFKIMNNESYHH